MLLIIPSSSRSHQRLLSRSMVLFGFCCLSSTAQFLRGTTSDLTSTQISSNSTNTTWHGQTIQSASTSTASRSRGIGDFVAQGLSLVSSDSTTTPPPILISATPQNISASFLSTSSALVSSANYTDTAHGTLLLPHASLAANSSSKRTEISGHHSLSIAFHPANASASRNISFTADLGASLCWNQWTSLWSAEVYASTWYGDESGIPTATETHTTTYSPQPGTTWTSSDIWTEISTIMQGAYAITTETIPRSYLETVSEPGQSATTATWTETDVFYSTMGLDTERFNTHAAPLRTAIVCSAMPIELGDVSLELRQLQLYCASLSSCHC